MAKILVTFGQGTLPW